MPYPGGASYFGGTQDNGTVRGTDSGGPNAWTTLFGGDGGYVAADPTNTNVLYTEYVYGDIRKSTNGGSSWPSATSGISGVGSSFNFLFIMPYTMDPSSSQRLWAGGSYLWRTTDGASSWQQASAATGSMVSAIAVAPGNGNTVIAGTSGGTILRSSSALSTSASSGWATSRAGGGYVSALAYDPVNTNVVYAAYTTFGVPHVWKSIDGGATWTASAGSGSTALPDAPASSVIVDPLDPQRVYVGTDLGVYVSLDGGATWAVEQTGFATVRVSALKIATRAGVRTLYAFTHGRGAYRVSLAVSSDTTPPDTSILSGPSGNVSSQNATFAFASTESGSSFSCSLDLATAVPCASPTTYPGLADGQHTFSVAARDASGNRDPTPAQRVWTVDTTAPDTLITAGPVGTVGSNAASISFSASEPTATFECSLDSAAWAPCSSPASYSALANGQHTVQVRAIDGAGNVDATPDEVTWTVQADMPNTSIVSGPSASVATTIATFAFSSGVTGTTFACSLDARAYAACTSPVTYSSLTQGAHSFLVRGTSPAGNVDPAPAQRSWTVDTTAPETILSSAPTGTVMSTTATISFTSNEAGVTFECSFDSGSWIVCTSPATYADLASGAHTFSVRARDAAGNRDDTPAQATWTVNALAPVNVVAPSTMGPATPGSVLVASDGTWTGMPTPTISHRWQRCDATSRACADILGATASTYAPAVADADRWLRVVVTGTNTVAAVAAASALVGPVSAGGPRSVAAPRITGSAAVGGTLTGDPGAWSGELPQDYSYAWLRCDAVGNGCAAVTAASGRSYTVAAADFGHALRLQVTATNGAGSVTAVSDAVAAGADVPNATVPPTIAVQADGRVQVTSYGTWWTAGLLQLFFAYQWERCLPGDTQPFACEPIVGATWTSYTPTFVDLRHVVRVHMTATATTGSGTAVSDALSPNPVLP